MKKIKIGILFLLILLSANALKAQILTPVHWSYGAKRISKTEAVLFMKAIIDNGWHIYSQTVKDGGPIKTAFTFTPARGYSLIGNTAEPKPVTHFEKVFGMDVSYFENSVIFQQKIKLNADQVTVKGQLEYMTCNDKQCLPPEDLDFEVVVK
ncbi:protein-disulfide reductase DsbD domain-containing protein [Mucilaginibacter sp. E4BP6]|uniref:protein-disulfide reductase DsbD domain-containing protein n=1 Tax=Mucilaginibacter sp. E4BP6 TaxID=2723089 RepID=UPI0015CC8177|nr:protein-disulfide reductase DsbD domain-containing protein [Mucilaginibacter sp. E4BP6]NYE64616.1 thiol:disulfide interchange protein DsbD [Mucilaginibacter sp. E4BP6]